MHIAAYSASIAQNVETDLAAVTDQVLAVQNNHFFLPRDTQILFAAFMGLTISRGRFQSPTLRQFTTPYAKFLMPGLVPTSPQAIQDYRAYPLQVKMQEELQALVLQTSAGNERETVIVGFNLNPQNAPAGPVFQLRGTSTTAVTANAWSQIAMTWADNLPNGRYSIVGMKHVSANGQACRLIITGQVERPGCVSCALVTDIQHPMFSNGLLGQYGTFSNNIMPNVEVLANAANAVHEVILDIVPIGNR